MAPPPSPTSPEFLTAKRKLRPRTRELYSYLIDRHINPVLGTWPVAAGPPTPSTGGWKVLADNNRIGPSTEAKALRLLR